MSLSGKLLRGLGWYKHRSAHTKKQFGTFGDLFLPEDVLNDPHKMEEMDDYPEFTKTHDEVKVHKILEKVRLFDLMAKPRRMTDAAKQLEELEVEKEEAVAVNDETIAYSAMTKAELVTALTEGGVKYSDTATKAELLVLTEGL